MLENKKNKIIYVILSAAIFMLSFGILSCSNNESVLANGQIQDLRGKNFLLNEPIKKISSTHNPTLNHAIVLGNGSSKYISGFGRKDIANALYSKILPDWNNIICLGSNTSPVNKEEIIKLNPDLIVLPEHNWQNRIKDFEGTNIRTFVCFSKNENINSVKESMQMLAQLFNEKTRADDVCDKYNTIIDEVKNALDDVTDKPSVAFMGTEKYSLVSSHMLQNQMIEISGGQNISKDNNWDGLFENINVEILTDANPDYIFIPSYANYNVQDIFNDEKLSSINAIKNKNVFKFPSKLEPWDWPTCSSALGIAWMANKLHPNLYTIQNLNKNSIEFYNLLYNCSFNLKEIGLE